MEQDNVRVERLVRPGVIASLEPFDECCWRLSIAKGGKEIESGIWCPNSHRLVIDGNVVGFASTKEEVLEQLKPSRITRWGLA